MNHYSVDAQRPETQSLDIVFEFTTIADQPVLRLPVWTPGSYTLREFGRYLGELQAETVDGEPVHAEAIEKSAWRVDAPSGTRLRVRYSAWCNELTVRTPHVDQTHAFFTGTNVLVYQDGDTGRPCTLALTPPEDWSTFCSLEREGEVFVAPDYDTLADTPVEMGAHVFDAFEVAGIPHRIIYWGAEAVHLDRPAIVAGYRACVEKNAELFGGLPYRRYDFIVHITESLRGGLEHLSSTVLACPWRYFETSTGFEEMLGLVMHEHFHVWNIKRIKPRTLVPFDYERENYTSALWVAEGFTSYFDDYQCRRAGLLTQDRYLEILGKSITAMLQLPGRHQQSIARSSFDAWIRLYKPDGNSPNRTVSYYLKGGLVAWLLDLVIRDRSDGARSLDDVMKHLWKGTCDDASGYDEMNMGQTILDATGVDVSAELAAWVFGTDDPDWNDVLASHGMELVEPSGEPAVDFGWTLSGQTVKSVLDGGAAQRAGLTPGDELVAIDHRAFGAPLLDALALRFKDASVARVDVHFFRRGLLRTVELRPVLVPSGDYKVRSLDAADERTSDLFATWIGPQTSDESDAPSA
jgi:predicted metalloprotease with PDZ domain